MSKRLGVFAVRIMKQGGASPRERIDWAFRQRFARGDGRRNQVLAELFAKHREEYAGDLADAEEAFERRRHARPRRRSIGRNWPPGPPSPE